MRRKLVFLFVVMLALSVLSFGIVKISGKNHQIKEDKITIVTSFYPMYIIALNLTENINNVEVINLTDNNIGCLHDYQLTTMDMRTLNDADILILNGGEMEVFLEEIIPSYPLLNVIDASENISFLEGIAHSHGEDNHSHDENQKEEIQENKDENTGYDLNQEEEHEHNHEAVNGHVWLNMNHYITQVTNIATALQAYDSKNSNNYMSNALKYMQRISTLKDEVEEVLVGLKGEEIVTFHGAFDYLAEELGIEVIESLNMDSDTVLSAGDIANVINEIRAHNIRYLFAENQYSKEIANSIALETNATVFLLEPLVSGEVNKDSYLIGMQKNLEQLKQLLGK